MSSSYSQRRSFYCQINKNSILETVLYVQFLLLEEVITTVISIRTLFQILFHMLSSCSLRGSLLLSEQLELYFRNCPTCLVPAPGGGHYYCQINKNSIFNPVPHIQFMLLEGGHYYCQINKNSILETVLHVQFLLLEQVITV